MSVLTVVEPRPATGSCPTVCRCGQDLDCCTREHCPRCGCELRQRFSTS